MKKSLVAILLLVTMLAVSVAPAFAITTYYSCCPNGKPLNVREFPTKDSARLGSIKYGDRVSVESISNGWALIVWGGQGDAYVQSSLLSKNYPGKQPKNPTGNSSASYGSFKFTDYTATVRPAHTTGTVVMYWAPNTKSTKMSVLHNGDAVTVLAATKTWAQIYDAEDNKCGFVLLKFLDKD